jgi:glycosyltransferase involved in cell wall biosynthesis
MISLITTSSRSDFLMETARSVQHQTFPDFEWILLIDGKENSNDSILNWITENIPQSRITIIDEQKGRNKSLITAHELAKFPYIGWLDDDDFLDPFCLGNCIELMVYGHQLVYTNHCKINEFGNIIQSYKLGYSYHNLREFFCAFHFRLYSRELYDLVGGINPTFDYAMDYELTLRMVKSAKFYHLDKFLYSYRIHPNRISELHKEEQKACHLRAYLLHDLPI